jgi:hypothetical protein
MSIRSAVAPTWAAWAQGNRNLPGPLRGASLAGQPFLPEELGPNARLVVEIAWGADPSGDAAAWSWTDITLDVYQDPGISFTYGRADEASTTQPAQGSMTLDNSAANYSLGGVSPNWPNVKKNVPVRIRVDPDGTGWRVVFQGNVVGFTPQWDISAQVPTVQARISGTLRRLAQGGERVTSAPFIYYTKQVSSTPIVYYPLNEGPLARSGKAEIGTGLALLDPNFLIISGDSQVKYFGQGRLAPWLPEGVNVNSLAIIEMDIPISPVTTDWWLIDFLVSYAEGNPESGLYETAGTEVNGELSWGIRLNYYAQTITIFGENPALGAVDLNVISNTTVFDGDVHHIRLWLAESGADLYLQVYVDDVNIGYGSRASQSITQPEKFLFFGAETTRRYFGHMVFWNQSSGGPFGGAANFYAGTGAAGETALVRLARRCAEEGIPLELRGATGDPNDTGVMGPQSTTGVVTGLRECEAVDQGVLFDGLSEGLAYACRTGRENATAAFTIDVGNQELFPTFAPTHDDQGVVNRATARYTYGGEASYEDTDGPLGTDSIGPYEPSTITVNLDEGSDVVHYASWAVHLGTVEGYRYPTVTVNLRQVPHLAPLVVGVAPGTRFDLVNVQTVFPQHPTSSVALMVEGVSMRMTPFEWLVTFQCSPFTPWRIAVAAADTGDTGEYVFRPETDGSTLDSATAAGVTSLTVSSTGTVWTTTADDFPFDVSVAGIQVTVTNITGASSPQTFTVSPTSHSLPALAPVELWNDPALRL